MAQWIGLWTIIPLFPVPCSNPPVMANSLYQILIAYPPTGLMAASLLISSFLRKPGQMNPNE